MGIGLTDKKSLATTLSRRKLKIVLLQCPYNTLHEKQTQDLFSKVLALKIRGYQKEYGYGVLPVDVTDFFANHILLCEEKENELHPIMGFKSTTLSRSKFFQVDFPAFHLLDGAHLPLHERALKKIVDNAYAHEQEVAYNGSWTIAPEIRKDTELKELCRDLGMFFLIRYYDFYEIRNVIAGAVLKYKVEEQKRFVGFDFLTYQNKKLDAIPCKTVFGEKIAIMVMHYPTPQAINWAKTFDMLWDNRVVIEKAETISTQKKAS